MPLKIIRQDITKIKCDVIVDPTDPHYSHGGAVAEAYYGMTEQEISAALSYLDDPLRNVVTAFRDL